MRNISAILLGILAAAAWGCCSCESQDGGLKPLFGENLSGANYNKGVWSISDDGVLSATKDEIIFTNKDYKDFELELEFKLFSGSNSGVVVYCTDTSKWIPNSLEIQIADNRKFNKDKWTCGSIFGLVSAEWDTTMPLETWHKMKIRCKGQIINVWIDGKHTAEMDMSKWTDLTTNPDGTKIPPWIAKIKKSEAPTVGKIGLQGKHGDASINFRNVFVLEIAK